MKKILIPIIGLLVLIILTPIIIGKMANSNIDKKIEIFKKEGIQISELQNDIGYLNTKRVFEVTFDKNTKNKTWQIYNKIINEVKFKVILTFKNLPITKAKFDINTQYIKILNQNLLQGLKIYITSKDFKTFNYKIDDYNKDIKLIGFNGVYLNKKYGYNDFNIKDLEIGNFLKSEDNKAKIIVKDLNLGLIDYNWQSKKWKLNINNIVVKGENTDENFTTHLLPSKLYNIDDKILSDKIGVEFNNQIIAVSYFDWNLKFNNFKKNSFKDSNVNLAILWSETEYNKVIVGGGEIKLQLKILTDMPKSFKDIVLDTTIRFDKDLFNTITKDLDPAMMNSYFKNYSSHIMIKNGELFINGNRIQ